MKQRISALFIGALLFFSFFSYGVNRDVVCVASTTSDYQPATLSPKTLYIDFSLVEGYQDDQLYWPTFTYFETEEKVVALIKKEGGVFYTNEPVSSEFLLKEERRFKISLTEKLCTSWVVDKRFLLDERYNYLYFSPFLLQGELFLDGYGYYGEVMENPGATYETQRVWLSEKTVDENEYDFDYKRVVGFVYNNERLLVSMVRLTNSNDGGIYYYADIPYAVSAIDFYGIGSLSLHCFAIYDCCAIPVLEYGVCFELYDALGQMTIKKKTVQRADSNMIARVVEAYLTFGKDLSNGSTTSTVSNLFQTWIKNKQATKDELKAEKIMDYSGYVANDYSYVGLNKTAIYSANEKWNGLCNNAGIDPESGEIKTSIISLFPISLLMIIVVLASIVLFVLIFLIKLFVGRRGESK